MTDARGPAAASRKRIRLACADGADFDSRVKAFLSGQAFVVPTKAPEGWVATSPSAWR